MCRRNPVSSEKNPGSRIGLRAPNGNATTAGGKSERWTGVEFMDEMDAVDISV